MSLSRLNVSRRPSFLITVSGDRSTRSEVVKRLVQDKHSRRRRVVSLSSPTRVSKTLLSRCVQNGHFIFSLQVIWRSQISLRQTSYELKNEFCTVVLP